MLQRTAILTALGILTACARLEFVGGPSPDALTYYEPVPYLLMQQAENCETVTKVVSVPGPKRGVKLLSGYGSADLSVTLSSDGILTSVNQKTDTKIPETIEAVTGLAKATAGIGVLGPTGAKQKSGCVPRAALFPIVDGHVNSANPIFLKL